MGNKSSKRKRVITSTPVMVQPIQQTNAEKHKTKSTETPKTETYNYVPYKSPIERQQEILLSHEKEKNIFDEYESQRRPKIRSFNHNYNVDTNIAYNVDNLKYKSKNKIESKFDASQSEGWDKQHSIALNEICALICVPEVICGVIESYVWTSAVIINKIYLPHLTETFKQCTQVKQIGRHYKNPLNIAIIGAHRSGKTNLVSRFYVNAFIKTDEKSQTDTTKCICTVGDTTYNLKVIDTGKGFHFLMSAYKKEIVRNAHCIMVVFDVNNKKSYEWICAHNMIKEFIKIKSIQNGKDIPIVFVGAKIDKIDNNIDDEKRKGRSKFFDVNVQRLVDVETIKKSYLLKYNAPYIECSAKCCVNIDHLFQIAVKEAMTYICNFQ